MFNRKTKTPEKDLNERILQEIMGSMMIINQRVSKLEIDLDSIFQRFQRKIKPKKEEEETIVDKYSMFRKT